MTRAGRTRAVPALAALALLAWGMGAPPAYAQAPLSCPPLAFPPEETWQVIAGGDTAALLRALHAARPGAQLLLADGIYRLGPRQTLQIDTPGVAVRGLSGDRDKVIIEGGYNGVTVNARGAVVADLTVREPRRHAVQVRGERGAAGVVLYNLHLIDAGQQFVKVSTGDGRSGPFADDGLVACSLVEYTTSSRGTDVSSPDYTNGVDILAGRGWVVRDNVFRRIRSGAGPAGPAILVWKNAQDTVIKRNLIIDSWRGIALGLQRPDGLSRGGPDAVYDHRDGLVENNVILALSERGDAAIENNFALNSRILHNTVYYNPHIHHAVGWSIEYRFAPTSVTIANNLTNLPIARRRPSPRSRAWERGNVTQARAAWFRDVLHGDFHLTRDAPVIDRGAPRVGTRDDADGDLRPHGAGPDPGADEYVPGSG